MKCELRIPQGKLTLHQLTYALVEFEHLLYLLGRRGLLNESVPIDADTPFRLTRIQDARLGDQVKLRGIRSGSFVFDLETSAQLCQIIEAAVAILALYMATRYANGSPTPIEVRASAEGQEPLGREERTTQLVQDVASLGGEWPHMARRLLDGLRAKSITLTDAELHEVLARLKKLDELFRAGPESTHS